MDEEEIVEFPRTILPYALLTFEKTKHLNPTNNKKMIKKRIAFSKTLETTEKSKKLLDKNAIKSIIKPARVNSPSSLIRNLNIKDTRPPAPRINFVTPPQPLMKLPPNNQRNNIEILKPPKLPNTYRPSTPTSKFPLTPTQSIKTTPKSDEILKVSPFVQPSVKISPNKVLQTPPELIEKIQIIETPSINQQAEDKVDDQQVIFEDSSQDQLNEQQAIDENEEYTVNYIDDEYGINEDAEEKEPGELETTTTTTDDESDYESDDSKDELDFLDTDARILLMKTSKEMIEYMNNEFGDLNDKYAKNVPKWRLHYERTGQLGVKFRGASRLEIKINDVQKGNMKFIDKEKTVVDCKDTTNKLILTYEDKRKKVRIVTNSDPGDFVVDDLPIEDVDNEELINENGKRPFVKDEPGEIDESKQLNMGNYNSSSGFLTKWFNQGHDFDEDFVRRVDDVVKSEPVESNVSEIISERRMKQRLKLQALKDMVSKKNNNFKKN